MDPDLTMSLRSSESRCTPVPDGLRRDDEPIVLPTLASQLSSALRGEGFEQLADKSDLDAFVDLLARPNPDICHGVVDRMIAGGLAPEAVLTGLLTPAARRLGTLWEDDVKSFVDVTIATGRLQELLRWIVSHAPSDVHAPRAPEILLVTPRGEDHTFGALVFHAVLRFRGWSVVPIAPFWKEIESSLSNPRLAVLGVSVGTERSLGECRRLIRQVRAHAENRDIVVLAGGPLLALRPELGSEIGADGVAGDADEALKVLKKLVPNGLHPDIH